MLPLRGTCPLHLRSDVIACRSIPKAQAIGVPGHPSRFLSRSKVAWME